MALSMPGSVQRGYRYILFNFHNFPLKWLQLFFPFCRAGNWTFTFLGSPSTQVSTVSHLGYIHPVFNLWIPIHIWLPTENTECCCSVLFNKTLNDIMLYTSIPQSAWFFNDSSQNSNSFFLIAALCNIAVLFVYWQTGRLFSNFH